MDDAASTAEVREQALKLATGPRRSDAPSAIALALVYVGDRIELSDTALNSLADIGSGLTEIAKAVEYGTAELGGVGTALNGIGLELGNA